ncbi:MULTISPECIES: WecB/TagA/CpsF family glycosyltransferase [Bacteroides]|uniref:WecB/TagA/CpsF family glycosyltransferase n=1 Tax=Bacteroides TaxID=816 RepID=UPI002FDA4BD8
MGNHPIDLLLTKMIPFDQSLVKRAPHWMVKMHLEFAYRIFSEPKKQLKRCAWIVYTLPGLLYREWRKKKLATNFIR